MRFNPKSLTKRVAFLTLLVALMFILVISLALVSFSQYKATLKDVAENQVQALVSATRLAQQAESMVNTSAMLLLAESHFMRRQAIFEIGDRKEWINRLVQELQHYQSSNVDFASIQKAQKELFENINVINSLVRERLDKITDENQQGDARSERAAHQLELIDAEIGEVIRTNRKLSRGLTLTIGQQVSQVRATILDEVKALNNEMANRQTLLFYVGGLALVTVLWVAIYINRSVVGRVARLQKALSLESPQALDIPVEGRDEIGWMAQSIRRYVDKINSNEKRIMAMNEELAFLASHDALTKLFNRHYFDRRVNEMSTEGGIPLLSAAMLDIDHFKAVNDTHGHEAGDRVIMQFADHLREMLPESALLARVGGEEFAVIFQQLPIKDVACMLENTRVQLTDKPLLIDKGKTLHITTSIGLAGHCCDDDILACLKQADEALYEAKGQGRNQLVIRHMGEADGC